MKMLVFARRNAREILRDPLTAIFSLGFPVVILALLTAIQANVPVYSPSCQYLFSSFFNFIFFSIDIFY